MSAELRSRIVHLARLGLGAGDIAYALGLARGTVYLVLLRRG